MSIVIHHPKDAEKQKELARRVAHVHAQTVLETIKAMPGPVEEKLRLIEAIKRLHSEAAGK